ncbi:MAG: diguanylate cyclase [Aminivibrio sp.]|uniref:diguanylate cyclase domain-containing protein n=1 Tax=Aminivibrio sp. TaxID=1872489 RepID=UPI002B1F769D|nr:diguanylate cyclase [Aminivibrio sp.]MEA4951532.1 diguanylate cyclase [Aminivibrio sp.]
MDKDRTIMLLEERVSFLSLERQAALRAFETALDLNAFTASLTGLDSLQEVFRETASKLRSMERFGSLAFFLAGEEDGALYAAFSDPPGEEKILERELVPLIEDRTVAWTLRRKRPILVSRSDGQGKLFLHSLSSPSKILGLFLAVLGNNAEDTNNEPSFPDFLSIVLTTAAGLADNLLLRARIDELNMNLQEKVHHLEISKEELSIYRDNLEREVEIRTRELETANEELRKEIEERRRMEAEVRYRAYHDALTGLANRDLFSARLQETLDRNEPVAVLFMDLDGFKGVNDTLGHDVGDRLLQKIARRLTLEVREGDTVARMGGDEFTIVVPSPPSRESVAGLAERILRRVAKKTLLQGKEISVTASIGISLFPDDGTTVQDLMKHADVAMYTAKDQGKNRFAFRDRLP